MDGSCNCRDPLCCFLVHRTFKPVFSVCVRNWEDEAAGFRRIIDNAFSDIEGVDGNALLARQMRKPKKTKRSHPRSCRITFTNGLLFFWAEVLGCVAWSVCVTPSDILSLYSVLQHAPFFGVWKGWCYFVPPSNACNFVPLLTPSCENHSSLLPVNTTNLLFVLLGEVMTVFALISAQPAL